MTLLQISFERVNPQLSTSYGIFINPLYPPPTLQIPMHKESNFFATLAQVKYN